MADSEVRQRKGKDSNPKGDSDSAKLNARARADDKVSSKLDILRVLTFLFLASCGLSYVISSGESFFWGMKNKPNYLRPEWWKAQLVSPL